jgi:CRISPR system Cascade subunit CasC
MLAEARDLNVDAAAQVAHAISTHRLAQEMDYWTAADDIKSGNNQDDAGAGMLGVSEFNASVFYRYACVSLPILRHNLGEDDLAKTTIRAFLAASHEAIPTGKVNGHAHFTPPFAALAVVRRKGMPLNLCNAFLKPVRPERDAGLDAASLSALLDHLKKTREMALVDEADYILATSLTLKSQPEGVVSASGYKAMMDEVQARL